FHTFFSVTSIFIRALSTHSFQPLFLFFFSLSISLSLCPGNYHQPCQEPCRMEKGEKCVTLPLKFLITFKRSTIGK
uniref:Uncharacterized protein n=1 Tax=Labrus bergylta TaxID=56723 RepID=A0A3Q3E7A7_9LABR